MFIFFLHLQLALKGLYQNKKNINLVNINNLKNIYTLFNFNISSNEQQKKSLPFWQRKSRR